MFTNHVRGKGALLSMSTAVLLASYGNALAYESPVHVFSINDVMGDFQGTTFGDGGIATDPTIICGVSGGAPCPEDFGPVVDKQGVTLYPVDSEFGFYIVDFLGAEGKVRDGAYEEGFVGNIEDGGVTIGIKVSNAATETYKVKPPLGTWCQGLGATSVKCETEHYVTMEHVLSCHETIPYFFADPVTGEQATIATPSGSLTFECANATLDDNTIILESGLPTVRLTNATPCEEDDPGLECQMFPNDKTDMQNNIALSTDYSVQLKDDGKPLYGWGGLHKRPNDVRLYARLALPDQWKEPGADFVVTRAELVVNHWITNNPNDQLRPEDLENEAATGRKPSYKIEPHPVTGADMWKSLVPCYEGDGDIIDTEEGSEDPTFIGVGTVLKNEEYALDPTATPDELAASPPYAFSSDLKEGFTNAYYTTINRDPFEWSYDANPDENIQDFVGSAFPDDTLGELVSGPRWRLKPNKFGQDLPGLEIPLIECSAPPFQSDNIKYEVGEPVTTVINLLDWADDSVSPLATSKGWVDVSENEFVTVIDEINGIPYTSNGLPMTNDFDLAVYIKGDRKSTAVYNAKLIIEYEGEDPVVPTDFDLGITSLNVPARIGLGVAGIVELTVENFGPADASGTVTLTGVSNRGDVFSFDGVISSLTEGQDVEFEWAWIAPSGRPQTVQWTATVTETVVDGDDTNPLNDTAVASTKVRRN
jgi:hypothetical protein